jgi:hypothetical protein
MILVLRTSLVVITRYLLHHLFERRYRFTKSPEPTGPETATEPRNL